LYNPILSFLSKCLTAETIPFISPGLAFIIILMKK
jgi:hypothetical protein